MRTEDADRILQMYKNENKKRQAERGPQKRVGAADIGKPCERALWYKFHWHGDEDFTGETLTIFEQGHWIEANAINNLRKAGYTVYDRDPKTPKGPDGKHGQFEFEDCDGHFVCKPDGIMPKTADHDGWTILEIKSVNPTDFRALCKHGVHKKKPEHVDQCIQGMGLATERSNNGAVFSKALYYAVNKSGNNKDGVLFTEMIDFDQAKFDANRAKALNVIQTETAPPKPFSEDSFNCRFCNAKDVCWDKKVGKVSCRSCVFAKPVKGGEWACERHTKRLTHEEQIAACDEHLFHPEMLPGEAIDSDEENGWVAYELPNETKYLNLSATAFPPELAIGMGYSSEELEILPPDLLANPVIDVIRDVLGARVVDVRPGPAELP